MPKLPRGCLLGLILLVASGNPPSKAIGGATSDAILPQDRTVLPVLPQPFKGKIAADAAQSTPAWPAPVDAPKGAPNVLLILTDDVGFAASSTFGGPIPTPNLDRLAKNGLRYNEFHTTAMCSPTRASLLTGRNHHAVSTGTIVDAATGYPGYWSMIPKSAATIAELLKDNGYNTAFFGKHHNLPAWQQSDSGPFDLWPTGLGFEYFFGFIGGDTDQWQPILYRDTTRIPDGQRQADHVLDRDLADDAIKWIHNQKAAAPDKPFFVYYAPGSGHAPHQAPSDWIAKFKDRFDRGWDVVRAETFARQKQLGIIPANSVLTPRPSVIPAWDSLSKNQRRLYARYMEVYAAVLAYQDAQIGRVLDELQRMGITNNTLVIFIEGDNGASGEGSPSGNLNEIGVLANGVTEQTGWLIDMMDHMGGPHTYEIYPAGWALAMNTPFQWMKQIASHLGGIRNGMVISWPKAIHDTGGLRSQFTHVIDIAPTILEATGLPQPATVNGVTQQPMDGISFAYTFDHPNAATRHTVQYFEMIGNRAIFNNGWLANTVPRRMPWERRSPDDSPDSSYTWELYNLNADYAQAHDLSAAQPARLKDMQALWRREAERNQVFPLEDDFAAGRAMRGGMAQHLSTRTTYLYWGKINIATAAAPSLANRSFRITATIRVPAEHYTGVLLAVGSWFGGWSFYLKEGVPVAYESYSQNPTDQYRVAASGPVSAGPAMISYDFRYDGGEPLKGGDMTILLNGKIVGRGRIPKTILMPAGLGETLDIGGDSGVPVTSEYADHGTFAGDISKVEVDLAPIQGGVLIPVNRGAAD